MERILTISFDWPAARKKSFDKSKNPTPVHSYRLWRDVVTRVAHDFPEVRLSHMYVDSAAMALVSRPAEFDVILTENMFGDILSDQAGAVVGSLGLLPSASVGGQGGLFEPIHGPAPVIV